jgi:GTP-binding protein HflX
MEIKSQERLHDLTAKEKKAFLFSTYKGSKEGSGVDDQLNELEKLCETFGILVGMKVSAPLRTVDPGTFIGSGKVAELKKICEENHLDVVIFDDEISPQQQRNLEKEIGKSVIDRTELILAIFGQRAQTREAKIQVELAASRYQLPRLRGMWTHLHRQRTGGGKGAGGGGYLKGEGEKQIELDRRLLRHRIHQLERELQEVIRQRETQRRARERSGIVTFAIIGYTNAGKSTLLRALTNANVLVEDKLFATLDTTTRKYRLPNNQDILLVDTVGFIRKLPHLLIAAFKSTLEEAVSADILLHIIDVSNKEAFAQAQASLEVLKELEADKRPMITILNKVDQCESRMQIEKLRLTYTKTVELSALTGKGIDRLQELMMREISLLRKRVHLRIPQKEYALVSELLKAGKVLSTNYEENDILLEVEIPKILDHKIAQYEVE